MTEKRIGLIDCPSLKMYRDFLLRRGFSISTFFPNPPDPGSGALLFCKDHAADPAAIHAGEQFEGPKLILGTEPPSNWKNAQRVNLPLLPLELENKLMALTETGPVVQTTHRVLLVEDDVTIAMTVVRNFQEAGFQMRVCRGFAELASSLQHRPELIVMDLNLPGVSGEKLGEMLKNQKIPVVIFSAETEERLMEAKKRIGAVAAFPKETPQHIIRDWIRNFLEKRSSDMRTV